MKLLLRKDIPKLGLCGDVVEVSSGYARNYLLPHHLALEPTKSNLKRIEEDKKVAAADRERKRAVLVQTRARLQGVEITISAACTPEGHLYGSVGPREIARALMDEGHSVHADQIPLAHNFKDVGTYQVPIVLADEITSEVKLWIVAERSMQDLHQTESETEVTHDASVRAAGPEHESAAAKNPADDRPRD